MRAEVCLITDVLVPELTFWLVGTITSQVDSPRDDLLDDSRLAALGRTPHQPQEQRSRSRTPDRLTKGKGKSGPGENTGPQRGHPSRSPSTPYTRPSPKARRAGSLHSGSILVTPDRLTQSTSSLLPANNLSVWCQFFDNDVLTPPYL
jgi:hypothetical protein